MAKTAGKVHIVTDRCKGCGLCVAVCPRSVLAIEASGLNAKGYQPAMAVQPERCIGCASCALICPDVVISVERLRVAGEVAS